MRIDTGRRDRGQIGGGEGEGEKEGGEGRGEKEEGGRRKMRERWRGEDIPAPSRFKLVNRLLELFPSGYLLLHAVRMLL